MYVASDMQAGGVRILRGATVDITTPDAPISGTAFIAIRGEVFNWTAVVTPRGWSVEVQSMNGRTTCWEGPTFNLHLEVLAAVRRHL